MKTKTRRDRVRKNGRNENPAFWTSTSTAKKIQIDILKKLKFFIFQNFDFLSYSWYENLLLQVFMPKVPKSPNFEKRLLFHK